MPFGLAEGILPEKRSHMRTKSIAFVAISLALAAQAVAGGTPITTCPFVITAPGHYYLAADLGPCTGFFAIQIASDHVRLSLEGHTLSGPVMPFGGPAPDGISATGVQKISIEGPGTITSFRVGIDWNDVDDSEVREVTASGNLGGFHISGGSDNNTFRENVVSDNLEGIFVSGGSNSKFEANIANNNSTGITLTYGDGHKLMRNTLNGNGFRAGVSYCVGGGIHVPYSSGNEIAENTANGNCGFGIGVSPGSTQNRIIKNTALDNRELDLLYFNPNCDAN